MRVGRMLAGASRCFARPDCMFSLDARSLGSSVRLRT
jgi:hypothetical protein